MPRLTGLSGATTSIAAVEVFGLDKATHAVLFFDKSRKFIGVKPTSSAGEQGAFKLSRRRRSMSLKAPAFFETYALRFEEAQRFDVGFDESDEMLTISVKSVKRRRGRRPRSS